MSEYETDFENQLTQVKVTILDHEVLKKTSVLLYVYTKKWGK